MYERFTDRARKVMQLANQEAQKLNHEYVGTEHLLLGLEREGGGVATRVLQDLGVDMNRIRREVESLVKPGPEMVTMGKLPQTPRVKKAIEAAMEEARDLGHNYVGTDHILLGLLREAEGIAPTVLMNLGVNLDAARTAVRKVLCDGATDGGEAGGVAKPDPRMESGASLMPAKAWRMMIGVEKVQCSGLFLIRSTEEKAMYWSHAQWTEKPTLAFTREDLFMHVVNLIGNANTDADKFRPFEVLELKM